ncbi:hypothetical protein JCM3774_006768 [Rhodotorula dairenensis]
MPPAPFTVVFVGAGEINFGSPEGPWNHSKRLENRFGTSLAVLGIIDPDLDRAGAQIAAKNDARVPGYGDTQVWSTPEAAGLALGAASAGALPSGIDLVIVGAPPHFRGCAHPPANLDLRLMAALSQTRRWLVEKPVSAAAPTDANGQARVAEAYRNTGAVVGAGYMMCALKAVQMIQDMIKAKGLKVMGTAARYYMAYEYARKPAWWNKQISCGPIVEQATHLASLSLLFGGPARLSSVRTHTVEYSDPAGELSQLGFDEAGTVPPESRIPRYTSAVWKYEEGGVGSLTHAVALHGTTYDTELEVVCDGTTFKLVDMYTSTPKLFIRQSDVSPQGESPLQPRLLILPMLTVWSLFPPKIAPVEIHTFADDDPFQTQLDALVAGQPKCTYEDALQTYQLTWAIRQAGERERVEN